MRTAILRPMSAFVALGTFWGAWAALLPDATRILHLSDGTVGLAMMVAIAAGLPAMMLAGRAGNRAGVPLLAPSVLAFAIAVTLVSFARNEATLMGALGIVGMASGALDVLMNTAASELEARHAKRRMHVIHAMWSLGLGTASISAGLLRQAGVDYRLALLTAAGAIALLAIPARQRRADREPPAHAAAQAAEAAEPPVVTRVWSAPMLLLGLLCATAFLVENGMDTWSALHLERDLHAPPAIAGLGPGLLAFSSFAGRLTGQAVVAVMGEARLVLWAGLTTAAGVAGFALAPGWELALPPLLLAGSGVSVAAPTVVSLAGRLAGPRARGSAVSLVAQIAYTGMLCGPLVLGALSDRFGLQNALLGLLFCGLAFGLGGERLVAALCARLEARRISASASE
jgi:MFS family permease